MTMVMRDDYDESYMATAKETTIGNGNHVIDWSIGKECPAHGRIFPNETSGLDEKVGRRDDRIDSRASIEKLSLERS